MRQYRQASGRTNPARHVLQIRPDHGAGRGLTLPQIPVEGLVGIADSPALDKEPGKMRTTGRRTSGMRQCAVQSTRDAQPLEAGGKLSRTFVTTQPLGRHGSLYAGTRGIEAETDHMAFTVLVTGTELDAGQQPESLHERCFRRHAGPTIEGIVVGDGSELHPVSAEQRQQVGGRQLAIGGVAVTMQVYTHLKKPVLAGIAG